MLKKPFILIAVLVVIVIVGAVMLGGGGYEKELEGAWYSEGQDEAAFVFYSDGSCEIRNEYGTGIWSIVNDDQLKISNYYGETVVVTIESIQDGCLTVSADGRETTLWDSVERAMAEE